MIPKVFHRIWLGTEQMPDEFVRYGESWIKHHPDWTMQLWTDENLPALINQQEFLLAHNTAQRADILRYEVIYQFGGVYIDTDFECLRNIEPLLQSTHAFVAKSDPHLVAIGIFGAEKGHRFLADVITRLPGSFRRKRYLSVAEQTGPDFFTSVVARHPETTVFEPSLFYPYSWQEMWRKGQEFSDAYAAHHWSASWTKADQQRVASAPLLRRFSAKCSRKLTTFTRSARRWFQPDAL